MGCQDNAVPSMSASKLQRIHSLMVGWDDKWMGQGDMACIRFCWPCRPSSSGRPPPQPTCHQDSEWSDEGCALQGGQPPLLGPLMVSLQVCACIVAASRMHTWGCHRLGSLAPARGLCAHPVSTAPLVCAGILEVAY